MIKKPADLIDALETIAVISERDGNPDGYFATLYLHMTRAVVQGIAAGRFENGARMERLIVIFGERYLTARSLFIANTFPGKAWSAAFTAHRSNQVSIMQHLLLGINAHINLDLGIAAGQTAAGNAIFDLKSDFDTINEVIAELAGTMQQQLGKLSWPMRLLDRLSGNKDEKVANFSISVARSASWKAAQAYALAGEVQRKQLSEELDAVAAVLAGRITRPGWIANLVLKPVKWFEPADVGSNIRVLREAVKP